MIALGWHPDPFGKHEQRFHDGRTWTDFVADDGVISREARYSALPVPASAGAVAGAQQPTDGSDTANEDSPTPGQRGGSSPPDDANWPPEPWGEPKSMTVLAQDDRRAGLNTRRPTTGAVQYHVGGEHGRAYVTDPLVLGTTARPPRRRKGRTVLALLVILLVVGAAALLAVGKYRASVKRSDYLNALDDGNVRTQFSDDDAAVDNAHAVCKKLDAGEEAVGYQRDAIGVDHYCSKYSGAFSVIPTPEEQLAAYLKELDDGGVRAEFANDALALANANRVCDGLKSGARAEGYKRDALGVKVYCPSFYDQYNVIPTPEEQRAAYLKELSAQGLSGLFSSDENAVAHAHKVCDDLGAGGPQQGMPEDKIGVQVYCQQFLAGFKVLRTSTISGTFTLIDTDPSSYFPSITSTKDGCTGSNGYGDIRPGTIVTVKNGGGSILTQATLGWGTKSSYACTFVFQFDITEGQDLYVIEVSHRGSLSFSFAALDATGVQLSLGS